MCSITVNHMLCVIISSKLVVISAYNPLKTPVNQGFSEIIIEFALILYLEISKKSIKQRLMPYGLSPHVHQPCDSFSQNLLHHSFFNTFTISAIYIT